jgi:thiamine-monophosphate kinase
MIDLSDGLAGDLRHIASESKVGVKVFRHKVPVEDGVKEVCQELGQRLEDLTLYWGEDYELLFTVPDERVERLKELGIPATLIGEVVDLREGCFLVDSRGRREPLREMGYEHFSSKRLY